MEPRRTLDELIERVSCVVRVSDALFGYVYERPREAPSFSRVCPIRGTIRDLAVLRKYVKTIAARAERLFTSGEDQAIPVIAPGDDPEGEKCSWFSAVVTQDMGVDACVAILYPFYDEPEAVRVLRLVEMLMTVKPLR